MRRIRTQLCTGLFAALLCLVFLSIALEASSDGGKDSSNGSGRLAEEDIERIADRLGERYACTRSTPEEPFTFLSRGILPLCAPMGNALVVGK